jgi:preprotein translocase subunit SecG
MNLRLILGTVLLVLISLFMVLVILAQRAKSDGGMGAALGGGMAEAAFGGETSNVLSKSTQVAAVAFFVLAFGIYLGRIHQHRAEMREAPATLPTSPELMPAAPNPLDQPPGPSLPGAPGQNSMNVPTPSLPTPVEPSPGTPTMPAPAMPTPVAPAPGGTPTAPSPANP